MNDTTTASTSTAAAPRRRRKSRKGLIFTLVVLVAAGGGWYGWTAWKASKAREGEYLTALVTSGTIEDLVTSTGKLQPRDYVDVGAQVSGQIQKLYVEVGDVVKKGQPLADIDAETAEARMESTRAQLANAENSLLTQIANLEKAERDLQRQKNLYAQDATTKEAVLNAQTTYDNAVRQKTNSELSIKQQKASMRIDEKNLAFTTIKAPIDGTVMSIKVKEGQTVNASQNVPNVMQIANLTTMTVQSEVSEADVAKLYEGIPVYFTTLGGNNRRWYGELKRIEPTPQERNSVVLYNALFDVQNEGNSLRPSMTAQVYFVSAEARDVLMVPMAALQQGQQIARELAQKEREKKGGKAAAPGAPGAPGAAGAPGAVTGGPGSNVAASARDGAATPAAAVGSAPAAAATAGAAPNGQQANAQGNRPANAQGNRQANNGQGNRQGSDGQGMRNGQNGGGFNGPRPGSSGQAGGNGQRPGGFGGAGGFNPQNMTPEQLEQMRARFQQGGGASGQRGGGFNGAGFNGQRGGGAAGAIAAMSGAASGPRPVQQQRRGTVMVKKADGTLEARQVVVGVTDRVHGQVISGLKEGEEVIVGKRETETATTPRPNNNNNNFQNNRGGNQGFPGGGGNFRPF